MKSIAFWKHERELLSKTFRAFLESQARGGGRGAGCAICVLEASGADGERYACVSKKKSQPMLQKEATVPMTSSDAVSWGTSLEKGEAIRVEPSGRLYGMGVGRYMGWGWGATWDGGGAPHEKVRPGAIPTPAGD